MASTSTAKNIPSAFMVWLVDCLVWFSSASYAVLEFSKDLSTGWLDNSIELFSVDNNHANTIAT